MLSETALPSIFWRAGNEEKEILKRQKEMHPSPSKRRRVETVSRPTTPPPDSDTLSGGTV